MEDLCNVYHPGIIIILHKTEADVNIKQNEENDVGRAAEFILCL